MDDARKLLPERSSGYRWLGLTNREALPSSSLSLSLSLTLIPMPDDFNSP